VEGSPEDVFDVPGVTSEWVLFQNPSYLRVEWGLDVVGITLADIRLLDVSTFRNLTVDSIATSLGIFPGNVHAVNMSSSESGDLHLDIDIQYPFPSKLRLAELSPKMLLNETHLLANSSLSNYGYLDSTYVFVPSPGIHIAPPLGHMKGHTVTFSVQVLEADSGFNNQQQTMFRESIAAAAAVALAHVSVVSVQVFENGSTHMAFSVTFPLPLGYSQFAETVQDHPEIVLGTGVGMDWVLLQNGPYSDTRPIWGLEIHELSLESLGNASNMEAFLIAARESVSVATGVPLDKVVAGEASVGPSGGVRLDVVLEYPSSGNPPIAVFAPVMLSNASDLLAGSTLASFGIVSSFYVYVPDPSVEVIPSIEQYGGHSVLSSIVFPNIGDGNFGNSEISAFNASMSVTAGVHAADVSIISITYDDSGNAHVQSVVVFPRSARTQFAAFAQILASPENIFSAGVVSEWLMLQTGSYQRIQWGFDINNFPPSDIEDMEMFLADINSSIGNGLNMSANFVVINDVSSSANGDVHIDVTMYYPETRSLALAALAPVLLYNASELLAPSDLGRRGNLSSTYVYIPGPGAELNPQVDVMIGHTVTTSIQVWGIGLDGLSLEEVAKFKQALANAAGVSTSAVFVERITIDDLGHAHVHSMVKLPTREGILELTELLHHDPAAHLGQGAVSDWILLQYGHDLVQIIQWHLEIDDLKLSFFNSSEDVDGLLTAARDSVAFSVGVGQESVHIELLPSGPDGDVRLNATVQYPSTGDPTVGVKMVQMIQSTSEMLSGSTVAAYGAPRSMFVYVPSLGSEVPPPSSIAPPTEGYSLSSRIVFTSINAGAFGDQQRLAFITRIANAAGVSTDHVTIHTVTIDDEGHTRVQYSALIASPTMFASFTRLVVENVETLFSAGDFTEWVFLQHSAFSVLEGAARNQTIEWGLEVNGLSLNDLSAGADIISFLGAVNTSIAPALGLPLFRVRIKDIIDAPSGDVQIRLLISYPTDRYPATGAFAAYLLQQASVRSLNGSALRMYGSLRSVYAFVDIGYSVDQLPPLVVVNGASISTSIILSGIKPYHSNNISAYFSDEDRFEFRQEIASAAGVSISQVLIVNTTLDGNWNLHVQSVVLFESVSIIQYTAFSQSVHGSLFGIVSAIGDATTEWVMLQPRDPQPLTLDMTFQGLSYSSLVSMDGLNETLRTTIIERMAMTAGVDLSDVSILSIVETEEGKVSTKIYVSVPPDGNMTADEFAENLLSQAWSSEKIFDGTVLENLGPVDTANLEMVKLGYACPFFTDLPFVGHSVSAQLSLTGLKEVNFNSLLQRVFRSSLATEAAVTIDAVTILTIGEDVYGNTVVSFLVVYPDGAPLNAVAASAFSDRLRTNTTDIFKDTLLEFAFQGGFLENCVQTKLMPMDIDSDYAYGLSSIGIPQNPIDEGKPPIANAPPPLFQWGVGSWSVCPVQCGGGVVNRSVFCQDSRGNVIDTFICSSLPATPPSTQRCNTFPCTPTTPEAASGSISLSNLGFVVAIVGVALSVVMLVGLFYLMMQRRMSILSQGRYLAQDDSLTQTNPLHLNIASIEHGDIGTRGGVLYVPPDDFMTENPVYRRVRRMSNPDAWDPANILAAMPRGGASGSGNGPSQDIV